MQRVNHASVSVGMICIHSLKCLSDGNPVSSIGKGILVLLGIDRNDTKYAS